MWYSTIYRNMVLPNVNGSGQPQPLGAIFNLTSCTVRNFALDANAASRAQIDGAGGGMDYDGQQLGRRRHLDAAHDVRVAGETGQVRTADPSTTRTSCAASRCRRRPNCCPSYPSRRPAPSICARLARLRRGQSCAPCKRSN